MGGMRLTTTLQKRGPAAAVVLDDEQVEQIGEGAKRFPVVATVNGYTWRTTVVRMGGEFLLGMSKEVRAGAGRGGRRHRRGRDRARHRPARGRGPGGARERAGE